MFRRHAGALAFAVLAVGTGAALGVWGWPQPHRAIEFAALIFAAVVAAVFAVRPVVATDVDDCTALGGSSI